MASLKEIITKAVIGKAKKNITEELVIESNNKVDSVLGCWVINHNFNGIEKDDKVSIDGSYDINVWYAYENNTKTDVLVQSFIYKENINVNIQKDNLTDDNKEVIVRNLKVPTVSNVEIDNTKIKLKTEKELGVEIVGDMKLRINALDEIDDYTEDIDEKEIELEIKEDYIEGVNQ